MCAPEYLIVPILIGLAMGFMILGARRDRVIQDGEDKDKATARMILLVPVWPLWVAYHVIRGIFIGLCWTFYNAFKEDK